MSLRSTFSLPEEEEEPVGVSARQGGPSVCGGGGGRTFPLGLVRGCDPAQSPQARSSPSQPWQ